MTFVKVFSVTFANEETSALYRIECLDNHKHHKVVMIDVDKIFHESRQNMMERYYNSDLIHLTSS